ncbi:hypothetical protein B0H13DRAFT_2345990 [Mycena leptocephala]|nr:hypothetical protein B0H13DRAFT_2345990 [Mycena leptocephala]
MSAFTFFLASWMRISSTPSPPPSFHPLVAAKCSRVSTVVVCPRLPTILVALATPGRYYNLTTNDIQRHAV